MKNNLTCYFLRDSRASWLEESRVIPGGLVKDVIGLQCVNMQLRLQTQVWAHIKHAAWRFSRMDKENGSKMDQTKECLVEGSAISSDL